jgi:uncharacterized damage-inducible protein DinB
MVTPEDARRIVAYDRAVFERFLRRLERLPEAELTRDRGLAHRSLRATMVHILFVWDAWVGYVIPGRIEEMRGLDPEYGATDSWARLRSQSLAVWTKVEASVAGWNERSMRRRVKAPWMPGAYTVEDALWQASFEEAHHLGEIIAALWQEDRRPPEMTWIEVSQAIRAGRP